jgi:hypothetical protein
MELIQISSLQEYLENTKRGFEPLMNSLFVLPLSLRMEIQEQLFGGRKDTLEKYFQWVWNHKSHVCEESGIHLPYYSRKFISHILSRGAHPEMARDPRNNNILSFDNHRKWEVGDRKSMRIYQRNELTIELLKSDYRDYYKTYSL